MTLAGGFRRQGMTAQEARHASRLMGTPRVVFHGAGAQRVEHSVDGVVLTREIRKMTHGLQFGYLWQPRCAHAQQRFGNVCQTLGLGIVDSLSRRTASLSAQLENGLTLLLCTDRLFQRRGICIDNVHLAHEFAPAALVMARSKAVTY